MILRVYALYRRSLYILIFLMILWGAQIITSAIGLHTGFSKKRSLLSLFFIDLNVTVVALPSILTGIIVPCYYFYDRSSRIVPLPQVVF